MKTRTPFSSVILYILGIIFMIVAAFMLWTAINYTKIYLASYDTTFEEMWSNSVQYVIEKVLPSFAAGIICLGLGKAISVFKKGLAAQAAGIGSAGKGNEAAAGSVEEVSIRLKELREVGSIKLEELERREKVRLDDMRETVVRDMALHRLQREAKEEEIISKLNAMGEKMGLDMADLYAKADIPVVPEMDTEEPEEEDKLKNDPLFDELDKAEETPAEETPEEVAEEPVEESRGDEQVLTHRDEPGVPEQVDTESEEGEEPAEQTEEEPAEEPDEQTEEEPAEEPDEQIEEEPAEEPDEQIEEEPAEEPDEQVDEEPKGEETEAAEEPADKPKKPSKKKQKKRKKKNKK